MYLTAPPVGTDCTDENFEQFDLAQCKIYLLHLAKDLYMNYQLNNKGITKKILKNVQINGQKQSILSVFRPRRSLSNPIEYVSSDQVKRADMQKFVKKNSNDKPKEGLNKSNILQLPDQAQVIKIVQPFDPNMSIIGARKSIITKPFNRTKKITINQFDASFISNEDIELQANFNILGDVFQ